MDRDELDVYAKVLCPARRSGASRGAAEHWGGGFGWTGVGAVQYWAELVGDQACAADLEPAPRTLPLAGHLERADHLDAALDRHDQLRSDASQAQRHGLAGWPGRRPPVRAEGIPMTDLHVVRDERTTWRVYDTETPAPLSEQTKATDAELAARRGRRIAAPNE